MPRPASHTDREYAARANRRNAATRRSPGPGYARSSHAGFLKAAEEGDFVKAAEYLDLHNLPRRYRSFQPGRPAEMLAVVIERESWIDLERLSDHTEGEAGDGKINGVRLN
jgi:hypothetical protein